VTRTSVHLDTARADRVGIRFVVLYALAFMSTSLVLIAPLLVTLALKINSLVGMAGLPRPFPW
jgi:hypothetical protein